jgi:hypothetical protein
MRSSPVATRVTSLITFVVIDTGSKVRGELPVSSKGQGGRQGRPFFGGSVAIPASPALIIRNLQIVDVANAWISGKVAAREYERTLRQPTRSPPDLIVGKDRGMSKSVASRNPVEGLREASRRSRPHGSHLPFAPHRQRESGRGGQA